MTAPKYLLQVIERNTHFCKMFKLCTEEQIPQWVEEANAVIAVAMQHNPDHSYVIYKSYNEVNLAKGEAKLVTEQAYKLLRGLPLKTGITTSTKVYYLGMSAAYNTYDFDSTEPVKLRNEVITNLGGLHIPFSYTLTPKGLHVHIHAKYLK